MVILDALFALLLFKLFGVNALYILGITACVSFLRNWGKVGYVAGVYQDVLKEKIMQQLQQQEVNDDENLSIYYGVFFQYHISVISFKWFS